MISIVTPSYNQSNWLKLAVASVADQAGVEHEHIVQDSLSHEGTRDWLAQATGVQAVFEKDSGMYDAINRGLARARGDLCGYLNCDEQYLPGTLQKVANFFAEHPDTAVLFGDALIIDAGGQALAYRRAILPTLPHLRASHLNVFTCAMFFRQEVVKAGHLFNPRWKSIGDAVWIYEMLAAGCRMAVLPELLSVFTLTGENLSTHDPRSGAEKREWQRETGAPSAVARSWQIGLHRVRKLLAGAYRPRSFDYEIYTRASPGERVRLRAESLGGVWPGVR